jgi:hypothetical protein
MSRGPGRHQKAVLDYLTHQPTSFETLRWMLWEQNAERPAAPDQDLPNKWNTSVKRAVEGLETDLRIRIERRRLVSLAECVQHYPNKTLSGASRRLRQQLLPVLLRWTEEGDAFPRYNPADNERFHLQSLSLAARKALQADWLRLEPRLVTLLHTTRHEERNGVFLLIAKGKAIFEEDALSCRGAFADYVRRCIEGRLLREPLAAEVIALSEAMMPPTNAGQLRLKSYIHEFADVPRHRGCSLKKRTVEYLAKACPAVVESLPGYIPSETPPDRRHVFYAREARHSPQLYGLFDQTVFQKFHFLQIA